MDLIIVESPNKTKKIQSFLGSGYKVAASAGHIRDLPEKEMGVEAPDYRPKYVLTKPDVVKRLKSLAANASRVILATDPDREGEAIAWHLQQALGLKNPVRVAFHEITEKAIKKALQETGTIDKNLVAAQEARRVLDRLVGYKVSRPLSNAMGQKASAGRVQSVAMRLVAEKELEIAAFKPTQHYGVAADLMTDGIPWKADWKPPLPKGREYMTDKALAKRVQETVKNLKVLAVEKKKKSRKAPAAFTTSTLQQAASVALKMNPKRTMDAAQKLFEEGLITYHRTDSPNLSDEAIQDIWTFLRKEGLGDFAAKSPNQWKSKAGSQEAHEAIRPTHISDTRPSVQDPDAAKLYQLIWQRTVACQMADAHYDVTAIKMASVELVDEVPQTFLATGQVMTYAGWTKLTAKDAADEDNLEKDQSLPILQQGQTLTPTALRLLEKTTQPPPRYTEASLVKKLEAEGIGRPSTYASIMTTIFARKFVEAQKGKLFATALGMAAHEALKDRFDFYAISFTRAMEEELDKVADGKGQCRALIAKLDGQLEKDLEQLKRAPRPTAPIMEQEILGQCPECGKPVTESPKAYGCSAYRDTGCKFALWKDGLKRLGKKNISKTEAKNLLAGKSVPIKGLKNNQGKTFEATGKLLKHEKYGWQVGLDFQGKS